MGKKLAIKGHSIRGNEVIGLLEMMGGTAVKFVEGFMESHCYYISEDTAIKYISWDYIGSEEIDKYEIFTLEEFLEKYPYKVGDKVYTKSNGEGIIIDMFWDGIEILYQLSSESVNALGYFRTNELKTYKETDDMKLSDNKCERTREDMIFDSIIWHLRNSVNNGKQYLTGGECETYFRELVKNVKENDMESCKCPEHEDIKKVAYLSINDKDYADEIEVNLGDDYEYKFEMNRLYILKKKPKYPTTYKECCDVLNLSWNKCFVMFDIDHNGLTDEENNLYESLIKLKRCRNAYWKIAGEEMGLGKSWDSTYGCGEWGYWIGYDINANKIYYQDSRILLNHLLIFPSEEMRDAFYENFKDLIEQCKELL